MSRSTKQQVGDKDIQVILGTLLRVGVLLAMGVMLIGGISYLIIHYYEPVNYSVFKPEANAYATLEAIIRGVKRLDTRAMMQLGTVLLILTPVTRVVFSIFSFLIERDYLYVVIGLLVLCVILFSLSNKLVG